MSNPQNDREQATSNDATQQTDDQSLTLDKEAVKDLNASGDEVQGGMIDPRSIVLTTIMH